MGAGAGHIPYAYDALQAEGLACLASLQWAQHWGITRIQIETDSQMLAEAINGSGQDLAINGHLFRQIKYYARLNFSQLQINYCPRACNNVVDALANYGAKLEQNCDRIWPEGAPEFVSVLLASDFAVHSG